MAQIWVLQAQEEGNVTVSVLKFTPKAENDGAMLICQATNEKLPDQAVQDSRLLSINCECAAVSLIRGAEVVRCGMRRGWE